MGASWYFWVTGKKKGIKALTADDLPSGLVNHTRAHWHPASRTTAWINIVLRVLNLYCNLEHVAHVRRIFYFKFATTVRQIKFTTNAHPFLITIPSNMSIEYHPHFQCITCYFYFSCQYLHNFQGFSILCILANIKKYFSYRLRITTYNAFLLQFYFSSSNFLRTPLFVLFFQSFTA